MINLKVSNFQLYQVKLHILSDRIFPHFPSSDSRNLPCRKCCFVSWQSRKIHRFNIRNIFSVSFSVNWICIHEAKFGIIACLEYRFHVDHVTIAFHNDRAKPVNMDLYSFLMMHGRSDHIDYRLLGMRLFSPANICWHASIIVVEDLCC